MYYRRKVLLALIEKFGGELEKMRLQKLLMLFCETQVKPVFHFVPYKYGCYSFQSNADLNTLIKYGKTEITERSWKLAEKGHYISDLKPEDQRRLNDIFNEFHALSIDSLVKTTYQKKPFLAINSLMAHRLMNGGELQEIEKARPKNEITALFTIGYEGISLEEYINRLILNDVKVLCDVRRNALSMKYGFSKNQLKHACEGVHIEYLHLPKVGIARDKRQALNTQSDYDILFDQYAKSTLETETESFTYINNLIAKKKRVALTCFEANICQCHRKSLSETIIEHSHSESLKLIHL